MRRALLCLTLCLAALTAHAAPAMGAFGFEDLGLRFEEEDGSVAIGAGTHPFGVTTTIAVNATETPEGLVPDGETKDLRVSLPEGFTGNPTAVPRCSAAEFADVDVPKSLPGCPNASAVGIASLRLEYKAIPPGETKTLHVPVYNLVPPPGAVAELGFLGLNVPVFVELTVNPAPPYNVLATLRNIPQAVLFYSSELTVWGNPAAEAHDTVRGSCLEAGKPGDEPISVGSCPLDISEEPFITLPRACGGPLQTDFAATSWKEPGPPVSASALSEAMGGCAGLNFSPTIAARPTTTSAESPSGLDFSIEVDDEGLTDPDGAAHSDIKEIVTTLPAGVTVNPSSAEGLGVCAKAQYEAASLADPGCPEASKLGNVEVRTPLLEEPLQGSLFLAAQDDPATPQAGAENPFDSLLALYIVIRDAHYGIFIKQAGKVEPDARSGQLITTFSGIPQVPLSEINLHFREGPRSPLVTPPGCGTYTTRALLYPWARPASPIEATSSFTISSGVGGGPCPAAGVGPFAPGFQAGSLNNNAASYSPFFMRLTRRDGEQDMTRFDAILPPGVTGKIAGVPSCPDAQIAAAAAKSGRQELAEPSCPQASRIGRVLAGAGVGPALTYVPGTLYLAGPFGGAPLSVVAIVPALAGPFDAGTVVTREALNLDPASGEVQVDGAASDPIPHILKGIPLKLRDLRVYVDRPEFTLNPTSCDEEQARATLFGGFADVFSPADDISASLAARYQAANCSKLPFKPKLTLALKGGTKRSGHPALRSVLRPRPGDANIGKAVVTLPPSEFIDNAHINNPCTRVQFNAEACPKSSILGTARAITPLLDAPLEGPVYFRSNGGERLLPDIVADLRGQFRIILVGFVDSKNARIRTTFQTVPDAPVTKFNLNLFGGKRGLLVNNRDICRATLRAKVALTGQNGREHNTSPRLGTSCKKQGKAKRHGRAR